MFERRLCWRKLGGRFGRGACPLRVLEEFREEGVGDEEPGLSEPGSGKGGEPQAGREMMPGEPQAGREMIPGDNEPSGLPGLEEAGKTMRVQACPFFEPGEGYPLG